MESTMDRSAVAQYKPAEAKKSHPVKDVVTKNFPLKA
jgi:hypothetical protein